MKNWMKRILALILAVAMLASLMVGAAAGGEVIGSGECGAQGDNITWELTSDGVLTLSGTGEMCDYYGGGAPWYSQRSLISQVVFDDRITAIGPHAFYGCTSLALTELPTGVTSIGAYAFYGCTSLALTELPEGLTKIEDGTFSGCEKLALTKLPKGVTEIGESAFAQCYNLALTELPEGITRIARAAFFYCSKLQLSELPAGLTYIAEKAFWCCNRLALKELPESITRIGYMAFCKCPSLALTELPKGLLEISGDAFDDCSSLALRELPNEKVKVSNGAFDGSTWAISEEHYIQKVSGDEYTLKESESSLQASPVKIAAKAYQGFHPTSDENPSVSIPRTGIPYGQAITLKQYYDRDICTVTFSGADVPSQSVRYGGTATEPELEKRPGYKLVWVTEDGEHFDFDTPITEPITISPVWAPVGAIHGVVVDTQGRPVSGAHIAIVAGNTDYLETDTNESGHFWIYDVPYGTYDIVATKRVLTVTSLFELDDTLEECTITLPDAQTNSILVVNQGTKDVVVGGLDNLFNGEIYSAEDHAVVADGGSVTVRMTVQEVTEEEIQEAAQELKAVAQADGKVINGYMEMDVVKITETVSGEVTETPLTDLPQLLQIIDPLSEDQKGKTGYVIYRVHDDHVDAITTTPNEHGAYMTVSDDSITVFASKFSAYCLAFDALEPEPTPTPTPEPTPTPTPTPTPEPEPDDGSDDDESRKNPFIDVHPDDWFYEDVLDAYDAGYIEGITTSTFEPNAPMNRAQAAYAFAKMAKAELQGMEITSDFEDVTRTTTYAQAITWANDAGVEIGYGNGKFGPTDSLTREQLALMLYRVYGNGRVIPTWEGDFSDVGAVSYWAEEAVRWAVSEKLLGAVYGKQLRPQGSVTRAEAAGMILRVIKREEKRHEI